MIQRVVFKFILPLLIFAVLLGTMQSITDHSINPRHDSLIDQLQEFSREAHIGESLDAEPNRAEAQMRGVTTFNALSAMNCLHPSVIYHHDTGIDHNNREDDYQQASSYLSDEEDLDIDSDEIREGFENWNHDPADWDSVMQYGDRTEKRTGDDGESLFSYGPFSDSVDDEELMNTIVEDEDYSLTCLGAEPISIADHNSLGDVMDTAKSAAIQGGAMTAGGVVGGAVGFMTGPVGPAAGTAAGMFAAQTFYRGVGFLSGEDTPLQLFEGNAAQGKFGQIEFTIHEEFVIEEPRLFAWKMEWARHDGGATDAITDETLPSPDFTRGQRAMIFYPEGIAQFSAASHMNDEFEEGLDSGNPPDTQEAIKIEEYGEGVSDSFSRDPVQRRRMITPYNEFANEHLDIGQDWELAYNAYRVRMNGVPTVISSSNAEIDFIESHDDTDQEIANEAHSELVTNTEYIFCEGSNGVIQSNEGDLNESGKGYLGNDIVEELRDVVFPQIRMFWDSEEEFKECFETHSEIDDYSELDELDLGNIGWIDSSAREGSIYVY